MKIAAITRFKHGDLYALLRQLNWTQSELGRRSGLSTQTVGHIINLQHRPNTEQADKIQKALGDVGVFLDVLSQWPDSMPPLKRNHRIEQFADIQFDSLEDHPEVLQLPAPEPDEEREGLRGSMEQVLSELTPCESEAIRQRFFEARTLAEAARAGGTTREAVRQSESAALRKLRHPAMLKRLLRMADIDPKSPFDST
jgi:RNA polymerase sigma factor (sigma-70 family)